MFILACCWTDWRGWNKEVGWPRVAARRGEGDVGVREVSLGDAMPVAGVGISECVSPKFNDSCSSDCFDNPLANMVRSPAVNDTAFVR